ncbi:MAG: HAD-IB family phosphatase [Meiothermus sp.]|nr:HAD-IB family phosphatase [Meiothermus sp.]
MTIASDLEGTLTSGETWKGMAAWMKANGRGAQYRAFFNRNLPGAVLARLGFGDRRAFQDRFMVGAAGLLEGLSALELAAVGRWVVEHELWPGVHRSVMDELVGAAQTGERVILCSATFQPILEAFAERMGHGVVALGTPLEMAAGRFTGRVVGRIRSGEAKAEQLKAYLKGARLDVAYGDTLPDRFMLELAQSPVAVYPDRGLKELGRGKGWRVIGG